MKKIFLISSLLLFVGAIIAQAAPNHIGTKSKYPIGNKDVSAEVYLLFLKEHATGQKYTLWDNPKYYESSFMDTDHFTSNVSCIKQIKVLPRNGSAYFDYELIPKHADDIIDALSSQEVQQEFNDWYAEWLKNPTWSEVCDYINDKLKGHFDSHYEELANAIEQKYPEALQWNTAKHVFSFGYYAYTTNTPLPSSGNVFQFVDIIVDLIYNGGINAGFPPYNLHCTFDFSEAQIFENYDNSIVYINFSAIQSNDPFHGTPPVMATMGAVTDDVGWKRDTYGTRGRLFLRQVKEIRDPSSDPSNSNASSTPANNTF